MSELPPVDTIDSLTLRRLCADDVDDLLRHFSDPAVTEYLDFEPLRCRDEAKAIVTWADGLVERSKGTRWTIRDSATGAFVGTCGFNDIERSHGSRAEIAYDLDPAWWRRGVMTRVMPRLLDLAFDLLDLHRVQAMVTPGNARSVRLLARHGFRLEGVLRGYGRWRGADWDQEMHALLRPERSSTGG